MHDSAGKKGEPTGDHNASEIDAEHGGSMSVNSMRACRTQGAIYAEKGQRNEKMNGTESKKRSLRHERVNPQRCDSRDRHEREIEIAKSAMPWRAFAADENEIRPDQCGRNDSRDVQDDRRRGAQKRLERHELPP